MNQDYFKSQWLPVLVMLAALLFSALDAAHQYDRLPPRVPSHFNLLGHADGWSTKREFVSLMAIALVIATLVPVPIVLLVHLGDQSLFNLPNKEYWFSPDRQAVTRRVIARWGLWFTGATLWLLALLMHETMAASFRQPPQLHWFLWLIGGYIAFVLISVFRLIYQFSRLPDESDDRHW